VAHRTLGETGSRYRGTGLDYADSRPYQAGDDPRTLDWRLSARAGEPYVRLYREERRPARFIVVDRRPAMCFATRGRLKAGQAAAAAVLLGAAAVRGGAELGGVALDAHAVWLTPQSGHRAFQALARAVGAPCGPGPAGPGLVPVLARLAELLPAGTDLVVVSDLAGAAEGGAGPWLRLAAAHDLRAVEVLDPAEVDLPAAGPLWLELPGGADAVRVDLSDARTRAAYREAAEAERAARRGVLEAAGAALRRLRTDDDPVTVLADWLAR
jgi:uncharacterized protein (DUF58 family)